MKPMLTIILTSFVIVVLVFLLNYTTYVSDQNSNQEKFLKINEKKSEKSE